MAETAYPGGSYLGGMVGCRPKGGERIHFSDAGGAVGDFSSMFVPQSPTLSPGRLIAAARRKNGTFSLPFGKEVLFVEYGRNALWYALRTLGLVRDENVLLPSFCCATLLEPFAALGIKVKFYNVDQRLTPGLDELEARIDTHTRALLIVHFFGFPQRLQEIAQLCRKHGIALIEDCAHGLFSSWQGVSLGSIGDVSIFSLRKTMPIPNGGALVVNNPALEIPGPPPQPSRVVQVSVATFELVAKYILMHWVPSAGRAIKSVWQWVSLGDPEMLQNGRRQIGHSRDFTVAIAALASKILASTNVEEVVRERRQNYQFWLEHIHHIPGAIPLLASLPPDICPYSFPVLIDNRDTLLLRLSRRGIFLEATFKEAPFLYAPVVLNVHEQFDGARVMARNIVSLPVYQDLREPDLERILFQIIRQGDT